MQQIYDLLDSAAKRHPIKALAAEIGKGESTLRNELTEQPGYKLGLQTALLIMSRTKNLEALDEIERRFGRVAYTLPKPQKGQLKSLMAMSADLTLRFGQNIQHLASLFAEGVVQRDDARQARDENERLLRVCLELQAYLKHLAEVLEW